MRTIYTNISDISPNQLSVNVVGTIVADSFNSLISSTSKDEEDDPVGEILIGDSSGCVTLLVTKRHMTALGICEGAERFPALVIKNVLPTIVFGRLRLELNRFSSVHGRHMEPILPNTANNISLVDHDSLYNIVR